MSRCPVFVKPSEKLNDSPPAWMSSRGSKGYIWPRRVAFALASPAPHTETLLMSDERLSLNPYFA